MILALAGIAACVCLLYVGIIALCAEITLIRVLLR